MRLINIDKLLKDWSNTGISMNPDANEEIVTDMINSQPIVYDVDKVVEELEEASFPRSLGSVTELVVLKNRAIEIVKKGGVE